MVQRSIPAPVPAVSEAPGPPLVVDGAAAQEAHARVVGQLRRAARLHALAFAHEAGRIVVEGVFDGTEAYRAREPGRWARLEAIAADPELPFGAVTLMRACEVFVLMEALGVGPEASPHALGHFYAVLPVGPQEERLALLAEAEAEGWTAERLALEVAARREAPPARGRRAMHPATRAVRALGRVAAREVEAALGASTAGLGAEALDGLRAEVRAAMARLGELLAHLEADAAQGDA